MTLVYHNKKKTKTENDKAQDRPQSRHKTQHLCQPRWLIFDGACRKRFHFYHQNLYWPNGSQTSKFFQTKYNCSKKSDYYSSTKMLKPNWSSKQCQYSIAVQRLSDTRVLKQVLLLSLQGSYSFIRPKFAKNRFIRDYPAAADRKCACLRGTYFSNFRCTFLACAQKRFDKKMTVLKGMQLKIININVSSYETHVDFRGLESGQWRRNTFQK